MSTLDREHAEALALAIEFGLADPREAIDLACQLVVGQSTPSEPILELAGALRPHPQDVARMLRHIPGPADPVRVFRKVLAIAREHLLEHPSAWPQVTVALEQMAIAGKVPELLVSPCYRLDDQRLLAERGTYGTIEQVHAELLAFLETEAEAPGRPSID
jgi:hypothetical protein